MWINLVVRGNRIEIMPKLHLEEFMANFGKEETLISKGMEVWMQTVSGKAGTTAVWTTI